MDTVHLKYFRLTSSRRFVSAATHGKLGQNVATSATRCQHNCAAATHTAHSQADVSAKNCEDNLVVLGKLGTDGALAVTNKRLSMSGKTKAS